MSAVPSAHKAQDSAKVVDDRSLATALLNPRTQAAVTLKAYESELGKPELLSIVEELQEQIVLVALRERDEHAVARAGACIARPELALDKHSRRVVLQPGLPDRRSALGGTAGFDGSSTAQIHCAPVSVGGSRNDERKDPPSAVLRVLSRHNFGYVDSAKC